VHTTCEEHLSRHNDPCGVRVDVDDSLALLGGFAALDAASAP
jgi:hypothetical protein